MQGYTESREELLAQREEAVSQARAMLRAEREQLAPNRAEAERLLAEAQSVKREALRARSRARRLAARFAARLEQRNEAIRSQLARQAEALEAERARLANETARFEAYRSDFQIAASATRDRLREAWLTVETQQKRAAEEWDEAGRYFTQQTAALDARSAETAMREKAAADRLAQAEAETAGLQAEAAALEQRVQNARASLEELEQRRERIRAELLACELPVEVSPAVTPSDLSQREQVLKREKAAVTVLRSYLERESADLDDRRRLVAEQLSQLADARVRWQKAERQTVLEMEQLARALRAREQELDAREQRLIRAEVRRRNEAYNLHQLQLQLQSWQSRIAASEIRRHSELEKLEADLARRSKNVTRREALLGVTLARWEQVRISNYAQLAAEREHWAADRERMKREAAAYEQARQAMLEELTNHAARALAAEQLVAETMQDAGSNRAARRLRVMRKRLERTFARKAEAINARAAELAVQRNEVEQRHRELHDRLAQLVEREAEVQARSMEIERAALLDASLMKETVAPLTTPSAGELESLREELERLAAAVLELEPPASPEPVAAVELPWALEEGDTAPTVLSFEANRAA